MADPAGILLKATITEQALTAFLNSKQPATENLANFTETFPEYKTVKSEKMSRFLAELLYSCNESDHIFLFHYDEANAALFFAFILNHDYPFYLNALLSVAKHLGAFLDHAVEHTVMIMSPTSGDIHGRYTLRANTLEINESISAETGKEYTDTFWTFFDKRLQSFPEPAKAVRKKNYYYKPVVAAYKKYCLHLEGLLKPQKIKEATREKPFPLADAFSGFYSYDGKVFCRGYYRTKPYYEEGGTMEMVECELEGADPYTFRKLGYEYADRNYVYQRAGVQDHPHLVMYEPVPGIDGATFTYIGNKLEHVYCKDKNHIYIDLQVIIQADVKTFKDLDFGYAKDNKHVYFRGVVIPIRANECTVDRHGFIKDLTNVFHYKTRVPLDGATFKVLQWESETNPFIGTFLLEDKNGRYEFIAGPSEEKAQIRKIGSFPSGA